jgi:hypothetical protein
VGLKMVAQLSLGPCARRLRSSIPHELSSS